jgi:hypothetical protein
MAARLFTLVLTHGVYVITCFTDCILTALQHLFFLWQPSNLLFSHMSSTWKETPVSCPTSDHGCTALQAVAELMYDTALVTSGFTVENPKEFASRIYSMVGMAVSAASSEPEKATPAVDPEVLGADPNDPWKQ